MTELNGMINCNDKWNVIVLTLTCDSDYIFGESSKCLKVKCVSMVGVKTYHRSNEISVETIIPAKAREPPLRYSIYVLCIKVSFKRTR